MNRRAEGVSTVIARALVLAVAFWGSPCLADSATFQGLGFLPDGVKSGASGVSTDGSVVVGYGVASGAMYGEAFRWTQATGMVGLGSLGGPGSYANGVSADGSVVVGHALDPSSVWEAFRWAQSGGMVGLGSLGGTSMYDAYAPHYRSVATAVSADGSIVVGHADAPSGIEAFRWTQVTGMVGLGDLAGGPFDSAALDVSADGSVAVGQSWSTQGREAFRWSQPDGMVGLGTLPGGGFYSQAAAVSADGSVVVGSAQGSAAAGLEAFRWAQATGMVGLGVLPGDGFDDYYCSGVSGDGSIVVGEAWSPSGSTAFIWDEIHGIRSLQDVLTNDYGLSLTGFTSLWGAYGISPDGLSIVGMGINSDGQYEAWRVTLPPVPAPGALLLGSLGAGLVGWLRRRQAM